MLVGAAIALVIISVFLYGVDNAKPEWGKLWILRPLIVVPLAGSMGGLFYHMMTSYVYVVDGILLPPTLSALSFLSSHYGWVQF